MCGKDCIWTWTADTPVLVDLVLFIPARAGTGVNWVSRSWSADQILFYLKFWYFVHHEFWFLKLLHESMIYLDNWVFWSPLKFCRHAYVPVWSGSSATSWQQHAPREKLLPQSRIWKETSRGRLSKATLVLAKQQATCSSHRAWTINKICGLRQWDFELLYYVGQAVET
jgi:hypothetical protein